MLAVGRRARRDLEVAQGSRGRWIPIACPTPGRPPARQSGRTTPAAVLVGQARGTSYAPGESEGTIVTPAVLSSLLFLLPLLLPATGPACAAEAGAIMTGPPGSTSVRLGQDIAGLARRFGVALEVMPSQGGLENIEALVQRPD